MDKGLYIHHNGDNKVPFGSSCILHISKSIWCSLAPNGLATQVVDELNPSLSNLYIYIDN